MKITILGSGASTGVPVIGCDCAVCRSDNPKNKRSRVSILVEYNSGFRVLVDTSPELRTQALTHGIDRIDAIIYTHAHADHTHGIDDVRPFNAAKDDKIPAYLMQVTYDELRERFPYVWREHVKNQYWTRAALEAHIMQPGDMIELGEGARVQTFRQLHGTHETMGLRFGDVVYSTDLNGVPEESEQYLQKMNCWILDCLRDGEAGSHMSLEKSLAAIETYQPKRAILTHMNHELEYEALKTRLPEGVEPGYDGLIIMNAS